MSLLYVLIGVSLTGFFVLMRWAMGGMVFMCVRDDCHAQAEPGGYCVGCYVDMYGETVEVDPSVD